MGSGLLETYSTTSLPITKTLGMSIIEADSAATPEENKPAVEYFANLVHRAFQCGGFDALCAVLRVEGAHDADWDPFEESLRSIELHNALLAHAQEKFGTDAARRFALLMYVHLVEMSAAHELLYNLPRVASGARYKAFPLYHLRRKKNKKSFVTIPPSASTKFKLIRDAAKEAGENRIVDLIDGMFDDRVRNAVAHSDYIVTDEYFRWTESGFASELSVAELDQILANCFEFYTGLLSARRRVLTGLGRGRRFHRWPNYEVLELLSTREDGVYGFKVHFSNGSHSRYSRRRGSADAMNMIFQSDGTINFMVGMVNNLTNVYKVNGEPITDWEALELLPREG